MDLPLNFPRSHSNGNLEPIGLLFSELAKQPVPPPMLVELLGIVSGRLPHYVACLEILAKPIDGLKTPPMFMVLRRMSHVQFTLTYLQTEDQMKEAQTKAQPPAATKDQFGEFCTPAVVTPEITGFHRWRF